MNFIKKYLKMFVIAGLAFIGTGLLLVSGTYNNADSNFLLKTLHAQSAPDCHSSEVYDYIYMKQGSPSGYFDQYDYLSCTVTNTYTWSSVNANSAAFLGTACGQWVQDAYGSVTDPDPWFLTCSEIKQQLDDGYNMDSYKIGNDYYSVEAMVVERSCQEDGNPSYSCHDSCYWAQRPGYRTYCDFGSPGSTGTPPVVTLTASPSSLYFGESTTLSWTVSGVATSCTASGDWSGSKSTSGGSEVRSNLTANKTYTITCANSDGSGSATASVSVSSTPPPPPPAVCSPSTQTVGVGETVSFTGAATGASPIRCSWISPGGSPALSGIISSSKCASYNTSYSSPGTYNIVYTAVPFWSFPNIDTCEVVVTDTPSATPPPTVTLNAVPSTVSSGGVSTLTWTVANATSCTASGDWSGSKSTSGGSESTGSITSGKLYTLTCDNAGGSSSASASVTVSSPPPTPSVTIEGDPTAIDSGDSTTLTWTVSNVDSCSASANPANAQWTGSITPVSGTRIITNILASTAFSLTCEGNGGLVDTDTVNVTVNSSGPNTYSLRAIRNGQGNITSDLPGISCGGTCTGVYDEGDTVVLTATPAANWNFIEWLGDCATTSGNTCTVQVNGSRTVTAKFRPNTTYEEF